jgi:sugar phosphate isomerase/epimerase
MPKPLAVQLYTFRDTTRPGPAGLGLDLETLEVIAEMGYIGVETVDVPGGDPVAARQALADVGLQVASSHSWGDPGDIEAFEGASAAVAELGSKRIIVSGGPFPTVGDVEAFAERMNAATVVAGRHGLTLGYHNHSSEMHALEGVPVYRRLRDRLDPGIVFQVDIFWVVVGGADPSIVIDALGDRVASLHVKDGVTLPSAASAEPFVNVAVGEGVIDVPSAVATANRHPGIEWLIVEFDHAEGPPGPPVRDSYAYLTSNGLGRGSRA